VARGAWQSGDVPGSTGWAYAAHLRVYEPLAGFGDDERRHWEAYVARGTVPDRERGLAMEHEASLRALAGQRPTGLADLDEHAFVAEVDGVTLLCPWRTRVRSTEALISFTDDLPEEIADFYLPRATAEAAIEELEDWRLTHPESRIHVQTSAWQVPVHWFLLVEPQEREVSTAGPAVRTLVYRTPMSRARRRVARALEVVRRTVADEGVHETVEDLARWLEEFHPRSLVELDYGGLVHLASDEALAGDESAADVCCALKALSEGRLEDAEAAYGRVAVRMKRLQAVEGAN
jgi:hypothetical protein